MRAPDGAAPGRPRALVTRPQADDPLCRAVADAGFDVLPAALTATRAAPLATRATALTALRDAAWLAVTSPTAVRVLQETAEEAGTTLAAVLSGGSGPAWAGLPGVNDADGGPADGGTPGAGSAGGASPDGASADRDEVPVPGRGPRVAAVGRGTARALAAAGVRVDLVPAPEDENAAGLAAAFPDPPPPRGFPDGLPARPARPLRPPIVPLGDPDAPPTGAAEELAAPAAPAGAVVSDDPDVRRVADPARHVVLPASALASPTLAAGLRARGWEVTSVPIYTTVAATGAAAEAARAAVGDWPDVVVLTAGSGARALVEVLGRPPAGTAVAVIGEPTARACAGLGIRVHAVAATPDPADLAAAAVAALAAVRR